MSKFGLVSTVDTLTEQFPHHCVIVFGSERDAITYAVRLIVKHDETTAYIESECVWTMGDDHWENPEDFLEAWQSGLSPTEYFHVLPLFEGQ